MKTTYGPVTVEPATGYFGGEVSGVAVGPLDDEARGHLLEAWMDWKVLFFRDQDVSVEDHIAFGRSFGALEIHPFLPDDGHPEIVVLDTAGAAPSRAEEWHTDVSFRACPPTGSILRGRIVPRAGGDTLWFDATRAYEALDDAVKERIEVLTATHTLRHTFGRRLTADELETELIKYPDQHHPLVRVHPVTGRRSLFLSPPFVDHIDGVDPDEGRELEAVLNSQLHDPRFQVRFRWREGSFAMWDNRCTLHCAAQDFEGRRRMERVTLVGGRPAGPQPVKAVASTDT